MFRLLFKHSWCYINYLHVGNKILVPKLGYDLLDEEAIRQIDRAFNAEKHIADIQLIDVDMTSIVEDMGGGQNFREDFDKYPVLYDCLERVLCPRVHFKMLVFDGKEVYVGSANLTGAGIGMKGEDKRNFEAGILTDDPEIVEQAMNQFDEVWIGKHCKSCKRREFCPDPIAYFFQKNAFFSSLCHQLAEA